MSAIEWPPGSGRRAAYSEQESEFMHGFIAQRDNDEITTHAMVMQINALHDLKVELGARMEEV